MRYRVHQGRKTVLVQATGVRIIFLTPKILTRSRKPCCISSHELFACGRFRFLAKDIVTRSLGSPYLGWALPLSHHIFLPRLQTAKLTPHVCAERQKIRQGQGPAQSRRGLSDSLQPDMCGIFVLGRLVLFVAHRRRKSATDREDREQYSGPYSSWRDVVTFEKWSSRCCKPG